jgi:hypothetical protein
MTDRSGNFGEATVTVGESQEAGRGNKARKIV